MNARDGNCSVDLERDICTVLIRSGFDPGLKAERLSARWAHMLGDAGRRLQFHNHVLCITITS